MKEFPSVTLKYNTGNRLHSNGNGIIVYGIYCCCILLSPGQQANAHYITISVKFLTFSPELEKAYPLKPEADYKNIIHQKNIGCIVN